ncbi:MAG: NusG domain II-containing protein [Betaproteobacteria bacterium]
MVGGRARVIASPCRDKICIRFGWLAKLHDLSACIPNRVLVTVEEAGK